MSENDFSIPALSKYTWIWILLTLIQPWSGIRIHGSEGDMNPDPQYYAVYLILAGLGIVMIPMATWTFCDFRVSESFVEYKEGKFVTVYETYRDSILSNRPSFFFSFFDKKLSPTFRPTCKFLILASFYHAKKIPENLLYKKLYYINSWTFLTCDGRGLNLLPQW